MLNVYATKFNIYIKIRSIYVYIENNKRVRYVQPHMFIVYAFHFCYVQCIHSTYMVDVFTTFIVYIEYIILHSLYIIYCWVYFYGHS